MDSIKLKIADFYIKIIFHATEPPFGTERFFRERISDIYQGFLIKEDKTDYVIDVIYKTKYQIFIKNNRKFYYINFFERIKANHVRTYYHVSSNQFRIILRNALQDLLSNNQGLIIHGSAALVENKAVVFLGKSGAGKSTIAKLISEKYPILADDNLILRLEENKLSFYQSPFIEKYFFKKNSEKYELDKIFLLKKAKRNDFQKIGNSEKVYKRIIEQLFSEVEDIETQIKILLKIISNFNEIYNLEFKLENRQELVDLLGQKFK